MSASNSPPRRLVRRTDDRVVAGVAGGVADVLGLDPVLVRIGFVVLAFAGGAGVVAYLALWLLTPEVEGGEAPTASVTTDRGPAFWIAIGLFVLAALAIADSVADRSFVWPLVLVGAGVALWRSDTSRSGGGAARAPSAAVATEASVASSPPVDPATPTDAVRTGAPPAWTPPPPPSAPPTEPDGGGSGPGWTPPPTPASRSVLGRLTLGLALLVVGVLAVLDATDVIDLTVRDGFAAALLVVGSGLVVGTWVGRARWLAFPALLVLLPGLVLSTVFAELDIPLGAGIGERSVGMTAVADVEPLYELGIGELTVNLGGLDMDGGDVATTVRVGLGQAEVVVPDDARVEVDWDVTGGQVRLLDGDDRSGRSLQGREVFPGDESLGTLRLDVEVAFGEVEVVRASDRPFGSDQIGETFDGIDFGSAPEGLIR